MTLVFSFSVGLSSLSAKTIETFYGPMEVSDPLFLDLLESKAVQRLKHIDQSGISRYFDNIPAFSRYDHSLGVFYILDRFKASKEEMAAGLLHDVSHTAFSHLGDVIFDFDQRKHSDSYQDSIHFWFMNRMGLKPIIEKHNLTLMDVMHKNSHFKTLEQPLPDVCADRLEYNLQTGYLFNLITKEEITEILSDIDFKDNIWFFHTPKVAKKFANLSLYFTENFWGSEENAFLYKLGSDVIKRALNLKILTTDDVHFSIDTDILEKLRRQNDFMIHQILKKCSSFEKHYSKGTKTHHNYYIQPKFRGINPWVKINKQLYRLTSLDHGFASEYLRVKNKMSCGLYLIEND